MINFCVPEKYTDDYVTQLALINKQSVRCKIYETYGSTNENIIGNIRSAHKIPSVCLDILAKQINMLHKHGIRFNYILNSTVSNEIEFTKEGQKNIINFVNKLVSINVDSITVSMPFLIKLLKTVFPKLDIVASVCMEINNLSKYNQILSLGGVSRFVLDRNYNRKFATIDSLAQAGAVIEVLCNSPCLYNCVETHYHANLSSIRSRHDVTRSTSYNTDEILSCFQYSLHNNYEFIKSPWIRPEDCIKYYTRGVKFFKIDGRDKPVDYNLEVIKAYMNETFSGNLLFLTSNIFEKELDKISTTNKKQKIALDNDLLSNFIDFFINDIYACNENCLQCKYCIDIYEKTNRTPNIYTESIKKQGDVLVTVKQIKEDMRALL